MKCPVCTASQAGTNAAAVTSSDFINYGTYTRKSDRRSIPRFYCNHCCNTYSHVVKESAYNHTKRRINIPLKKLIASNVSMRRAALLLGVSRTTVARKLIYWGALCRQEHQAFLKPYNEPIETIQFDELQTIDHPKCKPLSVAIAVAAESRKVLGFEVTSMPATGHLAAISRKKYGYRPDHRQKGLRRLFKRIASHVNPKPC